MSDVPFHVCIRCESCDCTRACVTNLIITASYFSLYRMVNEHEQQQ